MASEAAERPWGETMQCALLMPGLGVQTKTRAEWAAGFEARKTRETSDANRA